MNANDRSIWRSESHGISQKHRAKGKWNDYFTLHCNTQVHFVFTLHAKESETSSNGRTIFYRSVSLQESPSNVEAGCWLSTKKLTAHSHLKFILYQT